MDSKLYICEKSKECKKSKICDHGSPHKKLISCEWECENLGSAKCIPYNEINDLFDDIMEDL